MLSWSEDELLVRHKRECSTWKQCIPMHACVPDTPATPASFSSSTSTSNSLSTASSSSSTTSSSPLRFKWPGLNHQASCASSDPCDSKRQKLEPAIATHVLHERAPTQTTRRLPRSRNVHRRQARLAERTNAETLVQVLSERQDSSASSTASSSFSSSSGRPDLLGYLSTTTQARDTPPPTPTPMSPECDSGLCSPMSMSTCSMSVSPSAINIHPMAAKFFGTPSSSQEDLRSGFISVSSGVVSQQVSASTVAAVTTIHVSDSSSWSARREQLKCCNAFLFAFTRRSPSVLNSLFVRYL